MKTFLYLFIFFLISDCAVANIRIYTLENPPLVEKVVSRPLGIGGMLGNVISEKVAHSGKISDFEVTWVPWKRALSEVGKKRNALFFPLTKSVERENQYNWILPLAKYDCWLYAVKPGIEIKNLSDLKKYRVGVLSGSLREQELLKHMSSENIEGMTADLGNFRKLLNGRIDIWATQEPVFENAVLIEKENNPIFQRPRPLHKLFSQDLWLVGNRDMDVGTKDIVQSVFKSRFKQKAGEGTSIKIDLAATDFFSDPRPSVLFADIDSLSESLRF